MEGLKLKKEIKKMIIKLKLGSNEAADFLKNEREGKSTQGTGTVYEILEVEEHINGSIVATCRICNESEENEYWDSF